MGSEGMNRYRMDSIGFFFLLVLYFVLFTITCQFCMPLIISCLLDFITAWNATHWQEKVDWITESKEGNSLFDVITLLLRVHSVHVCMRAIIRGRIPQCVLLSACSTVRFLRVCACACVRNWKQFAVLTFKYCK